MKLTISVDNLSISIIKWWVDTSDRTHMDCKGHSGYAMSLGKGIVVSFLKKYKLNAKSTMETELVGADDALPQILWGLYFRPRGIPSIKIACFNIIKLRGV